MAGEPNRLIASACHELLRAASPDAVNRLIVMLVIGIASGLTLSCSSRTDSCVDSIDCSRGFACRQDKCIRVQCLTTLGCDELEICAPGSYAGGILENHYCTARCSVFNRCRTNEACLSGLCQPSGGQDQPLDVIVDSYQSDDALFESDAVSSHDLPEPDSQEIEDIFIWVDSNASLDISVDPDASASLDTVELVPDGMVFIPPGAFWMGCAPSPGVECQADEMPMHAVILSGFLIDRAETTQAQYEACVSVRACIEPSCNWAPKDFPDKPVVCVSWDQARSYCNWMRKRLPTEAEWEKAARGTDKRLYPWGDAYPDCYHAVINDDGQNCSGRISKNVCSRSPLGDSPYGACDMIGNVWEWTSDWYAEDYFSRGELQNPQGPSTGSEKVCRGGGYANKPDQIMVFERTPVDPLVAGDYFLGFRCAKSQ